MHIVLSGYYGFDNVGDEAILSAIIHALQQVQPEIEITVLSNNPESTIDTHHVHAVNRRKMKEICRVLKKADGLISGGGSLLQDATSIKSIAYYTGVIKIAKRYNKPVFIYAQGMGPLKRRLSKWLVKSTLNKVGKITVRDQGSMRLLQDIGVKQVLTIVPDPVLGLDSCSFVNPSNNVQKLDESFITVSVRDWPSDHKYKRKIANCLDQIVQAGHPIVFVPMHGKLDEMASKATAALMDEKSVVSPGNASMEEKISLIGESKLLIGMRLHALIFSAITYTPFVAISYDPKIDAFAAMFEQALVGHVAKDDWDETTLFNAVNHALASEDFHVDLLKNKMRECQRKAMETPQLALDTFCTDKKFFSRKPV